MFVCLFVCALSLSLCLSVSLSLSLSVSLSLSLSLSLSVSVCSVAVGFDRPPLSLDSGSVRQVESVAPHNARVVDMEVYTCALDELKLRTESNAADAKKKRKQ